VSASGHSELAETHFEVTNTRSGSRTPAAGGSSVHLAGRRARYGWRPCIGGMRASPFSIKTVFYPSLGSLVGDAGEILLDGLSGGPGVENPEGQRCLFFPLHFIDWKRGACRSHQGQLRVDHYAASPSSAPHGHPLWCRRPFA